MGHTSVDIVVADPTRRDLMERAARHDLVAAIDAVRRKETHYRDRAAGTKFVPFALETYGALSERSNRFLVECATLASRESSGCGPSISLLCTWFRQRVSIALQRSLAHAIHASVVLYYIVYGHTCESPVIQCSLYSCRDVCEYNVNVSSLVHAHRDASLPR